MIESKKLGIIGEDLAIKTLIDRSYDIVERNWRFGHKEVDIIAVKDEFLCIIEVKTRSSSYISPKDSVNIKKQKNLIAAANEYIIKNNVHLDVRFDVIEIIITKKKTIINHIEDAFTPQLNR